MSEERLLIIEDEVAMRQVLCDCLARHGYRVISAIDGESGLARVVEEKPDLVILDVMMPKLDGFALCEEIRRLGLRMPILFLSAKASVDDRVKGLDSGGDDYLPKPFSRAELLARVRALLRRKLNEDEALESIEIGEAKIDFIRQCATLRGKAVPMSRKEIGILKLLSQRKGAAVCRQEFLDLVWGYAAFPTTRTVDRHIVGLRQKFEPVPDSPRYILTVHGVGYRLAVDKELNSPEMETLHNANN